MTERFPLVWPQGFTRTLINDRQPRLAWKKTERESIEALELELQRFKAITPILTRKDPQDRLSAPDPSVAVWFSRQRKEDFTWQGALGIDNPAPTAEEINSAFTRLAAKYHPDRETRDIETYLKLDEHKRNALAFVNRLSGKANDVCLPCDHFREARWNINAIVMTLRSLRQMERDGTSGLLERAMQGFIALPEGSAHVAAATGS